MLSPLSCKDQSLVNYRKGSWIQLPIALNDYPKNGPGPNPGRGRGPKPGVGP